MGSLLGRTRSSLLDEVVSSFSMMIVISFAQMNVLLQRHCVQPKEFAQAPLPVPDPIPQNSPLRPWQATAAKDRARNQGKPPRMLPICPKGVWWVRCHVRLPLPYLLFFEFN